ncbi:anchored repeat ABC transporter, substrate-binding protein [Arcanobacterium pinnipediorum]|uniref:Anchored repeat ABC transporter, substrate-binding protein n=1 Tax=Arcanobacterium pinnipediorum TaxID=1503041 RepID=A0ABY5AIZ7_9ACTO|nr:anchored repeat ABC transporter, substrate-binding protein [Arcanobacterium pinnipediorum]USR79827.1 anchored repeat ABC transporter, substrate-binding protein [Arcanobacterium pinnipediorum]
MKRLQAILLCAAILISGCSTTTSPAQEHNVVASTPFLADITRNIAGDRLNVTALVPPGRDPHTYEATFSTIRAIAYADLAITNQLLLEDAALMDSLHANLPANAPIIALGDEAIPFGAYHIPLVEDLALSTAWLGLRVDGSGGTQDSVSFTATAAKGPGNMAAFTTGTFGQANAWLTTSDGISSADTLALPTNAHTHMSWAFSKPGTYQLTLAATLNSGSHTTELGQTTLTFAVGIDPTDVEPTPTRIISSGHVDITASLAGRLTLRGEDTNATPYDVDPHTAVIAVPHSTATEIPAKGNWRFIGKPGEQVWILAQAVIGKHVHGEIDPHMWLDVRNTIAYVDVITQALSTYDPQGATIYQDNAQRYKTQLTKLDRWMRLTLAMIPPNNKRLVTSHDGYGYFAKGYGLDVAGYVSPNPSLEPSTRDLANLSATLASLNIPAVFTELGGAGQSPALTNLAHANNIDICPITGDVIQEGQTYIDLMTSLTTTVFTCLNPGALPPWPADLDIPKVEQ